MQEEPVGGCLAMQSTQEGQMVALNRDISLPAHEKHYGFKRGAPCRNVSPKRWYNCRSS